VIDLKVDGGVKSQILRTRTGGLGSGHIAVLQSIDATATLQGYQTYEDIYWIESLFGKATPGAGPTYTRAYTDPDTAIVTPRSQTLYYGSTADGVYKLLGALASKLTFKFDSNKPTEYSADIFAKSAATGALASLSDRTVTPVMGNDLTLYIDAWGGPISTAVASTAFTAELELDTKRTPRYYLGSLTPGAYSQPAWEGTLKLRMEFDATYAKTYYEAMLAASAVFQKQVRLKATNGTKVFQIDFAGTAEEMPQIWDEREGVQVIEMVLKHQYCPALTAWLKASVTNGVSALP
jgi:hypothetical protein